MTISSIPGMPSWAPSQLDLSAISQPGMAQGGGGLTYKGLNPNLQFMGVDPASGQPGAAYSIGMPGSGSAGPTSVYYNSAGKPIDVQSIAASGSNWMDSLIKAGTMATLAYGAAAAGGAVGGYGGATTTGAEGSTAMNPGALSSLGGSAPGGADAMTNAFINAGNAYPGAAGSIPGSQTAAAGTMDAGGAASGGIGGAPGGLSGTIGPGGAYSPALTPMGLGAGGSSAGSSGLGSLGSLFGGGGTFGPGGLGTSLLGAVAGPLVQGLFGQQAANTQSNANNQALQFIQQQEAPYNQAGQQALSQYTGILSGKTAPPDLSKMPGYQFQQQQGLNAIQNSAASRGQALSGNTMQGLEQFGQGLASTQFQDYMNRLAGLSGMGQAAASGVATAGGNLIPAAGIAQSAGQANWGNAINSGISNFTQQQSPLNQFALSQLLGP